MCQIKAAQFRRLAAECERQAELASTEPHFRLVQSRLAKSYFALAETEDWLDGLMPDSGTLGLPLHEQGTHTRAA